MAAYQKFGVIIVAILFSILQKIKTQNYRLFIVYEEIKASGETSNNLTSLLNGTDLLFDRDNIAQFLFRCLLLNNCIALIPCIYLTSWSDKHGRKLLLMLPYIGSFIGDVVMIVVLLVPTASSEILLVSESIDGFLGGTILISVGCLCYITDSTDHRERTFLVALYFGLWNTTPVIDLAIQYFWIPQGGLGFNALILCSAIYRMACTICLLIYIRYCVSESVFILGSFQGNPWTNLIAPINISDTINCVFKRRLDNMRFYIIVLTTIFIFYNVSLFGMYILIIRDNIFISYTYIFNLQLLTSPLRANFVLGLYFLIFLVMNFIILQHRTGGGCGTLCESLKYLFQCMSPKSKL